jgi:hypothetical protein
MQQGKPSFVVRAESELYTAQADRRFVNQWIHVVGTLTEDKKLNLYVNGKLAASSTVKSLIPAEPKQPTEIGADEAGSVGDYQNSLPFAGVIDEVRVYHAALSAEEVAQRFSKPDAAVRSGDLVLSYSFSKGEAADASGHKNDGTIIGAAKADGKLAEGLKFTGQARVAGRAGNNAQFQGSLVVRFWNRDIPMMVQGITLADKTLFVVGPPDVLDEEAAFERLRAGDPRIQEALANQNASFSGQRGAKLMAVSTEDGKTLGELNLDALPVWDGLAAANGKLYLANINGEVVCLTPAD